MVVLDVFIGLVLVYFLYSLFVSIVAELLSTWIGMRARILRQGVDNFLNDKKPKKDGFIAWLHDIFLVEHIHFRYTNAGKFYNEPTIKYLAKIGENKRYSIRNTKPSYIEQSHFVTAILSMLMRRSIGINEWDKVKFALENNTLNLDKETLQMFQDWLTQSNNSYEKFKAYIGNSFEEVNDRLVGWYKRKIGVLLFTLGFIISCIMNVDTFEIVQTLANNPETRMEMVKLAIATAEAEEADTTKTIDKNDPEYKKKVKDAFNISKKSIDNVSDILGSGWKEKSAPWYPWNKKFWGFILTAFALSLGAKFWFDLLKKLVSLRGTGEKPDEHNINKTKTISEAKIADNGLQLNTSDAAVIALSQNRRKWETLPGFIAANVRYTDSNVGFIELIYEEGRDIANMPKEIPNPTTEDKKPAIALTYKNGTKGSFGQDSLGPLVGSLVQSTTKNWGTPAGVVFDIRSNSNVILTCGHVIRNDKTSFIDNTKSTILYKSSENSDPIPIGQATNLVLSSFCDAGVVKLKKNAPIDLQNLTKLNNIRDVTFKDENRTDVLIHTLRKDPVSGGTLTVKGKILSTRESFGFDDHPSSDIRFYDLFLIGARDDINNNALTSAGDSGALITDESGIQIGLMIGAVKISGEHFSFGIKLKDIFDILQLEPAKNEKNNLTT